jgi:DNA-binding NtrC family response regulator
VASFPEPILCTPPNKTEGCLKACADIIITDFRMPQINGIELLNHQTSRGCAIDINNKAVISGDLPEVHMDNISKLAGTFFKKPFSLEELYAWTQECLSRIDLSEPLGSYSV